MLLLDGALKDEQFAEKAGGEGEAGKGEHGQHEGEGEVGRALVESVEIGEVITPGRWGNDGHDEKGEQRHEEVGGKIENNGGTGEGRPDGDETKEEIAGMADAGVSEKTFEVGLRDGGEVAEDHGGTGNDREKGEDFFLQGGNDKEGLQDPQ